MYAFLNHRSSCFLDTVVVVMFMHSTVFDDLLQKNIPVARALANEVNRLRGKPSSGWVVAHLRELMGSPWDNGEPQSAVDFFHAVLDRLEVKYLGLHKHLIGYIPRTAPSTLADVRLSEVEGFRVHLAVAGQHASLTDVFELEETVLPPAAESYATVATIILEDAPVLVFEVGRNASIERVEYGRSAADTRIFIDVNDVVYMLEGVVCRISGHYIGFIWGEGGWMVYDDARGGGEIRTTEHPERHRSAPSLFGELFFYTRQ